MTLDVGLIFIVMFTIGVPSLFALGFILAGYFTLKKHRRIHNNAEIVELPVIRVREKYKRSGASDFPSYSIYTPELALNYKGKTYILKTHSASHKTKVGDRLTIIFNKNNPYEYQIQTNLKLGPPFLAGFLFAVGIFFLLLGPLVLLFAF